MITVMIHSVMLDTEYEFCLDSNTPVSVIAEEIGEVICQKEQLKVNGNPEQLKLFSPERQSIIPSNTTLGAFGIKTGDTLYFG